MIPRIFSYKCFWGFFGSILTAFTLTAQPTPSQDLDTSIGDSFAHLKDSILNDESISGDSSEAHADHQTSDEAHSSEHPVGDQHHAPEHSVDDAHELNDSHKPSDAHGEELDHEAEHVISPYTSDVEKADFFRREGDYSSAINVYLGLMNIADVPPLEHKKALFGLAETYFKRGSLSQSVSLLDQFLEKYPDDGRRAEILFQVGLLYREMRLYPEAITSFYRVLNSIVVTGEVDLPKYLSLARRAQFEIARSHYFGEQWDQALVLLDRIDLFELNPMDRESLLYYKAHATLRMGDPVKGLALVQKLLHTYPSSPLVPEMLYTKAETLVQMQQHEDAVASLMELLEFGGIPNEEDGGDQWRYWRQQAGNQFANRYFENRDFLAALRLYQGIAVLDDRLEWQLPIVYQMGLCFEKLGMYDRAVESLQYVSQGVEKLSEGDAKAPDAALNQLHERAQWRLDMLNWRSGLELDQVPMLATKIPDLESDEE